MNIAKVCKIIPSALPHEYLGYDKNSVDGMLLTIRLLSKVQQEEEEAIEAQKSGSSGSNAISRIMKHLRNR